MALQSAREVPSKEIEALFACTCLLHGNWPKQTMADVVFIPGLAVDNWQETNEDDGILATAALLCPNHAEHVAIPGNAGTFPNGPEGPRSETGYPGGATWKAELLRFGTPEEHIYLHAERDVGPDEKSWNTRTEIDDFVRLARDQRWTRAVVLATPCHLPRVMLTLVKAMRDGNHFMRLDPVTPRAVSWTKSVYHSQGMQQLPRYEHIAEEWKRIPQYQENGSICTFAELHTYLVSQLNM